MAQHNDFGKEAEEFAVNYLVEKGYAVLERNWRSNKAEIDIIAIDTVENEIVIIEVKSRNTDVFGNPEEAVTVAKQKLLIKAANYYITSKNINLDARFDIVALLKKNSHWQVNHIKAAFHPITTFAKRSKHSSF